MFRTTGANLQVRFSSVNPIATRRKNVRSSKEDAERRARRVQILLAVLGLASLKALSSAFFSRPQVTVLFTIWVLGIAFFLSTEARATCMLLKRQRTNFGWEWPLCYDSPLKVPSSSRGVLFGFFMTGSATYLVHVFHKRSHRKSLENRSSIAKNKSYREAISSLADEQVELDGLVAEVNESLSRLESALIPGGFRRIFDKKSMLECEHKVIDAFRYATRAQLNYLVLHVNMNVVLYRLKNHHRRKEASKTGSGRQLLHADKSDDGSILSSPTGSASVAGDSSILSKRSTGSIGQEDHPMSFAPDEDESSGAHAFDEEEESRIGSGTGKEGVEGRTYSSIGELYEDSVGSDLDKKNNRNALVELLAKERLVDLTTSARASILDALQVVGMMRNPLTKDRAQRWAATIILDTRGDQLSELKTITDAKGSVHSMHKLVYNDITDEAIRASLLSHFQANKRTKLGRKVLSDVDDTLVSSGGRYPAGIDASYPRHSVYPGAGAFYESLDRGVSSTFAAPQLYGSKVDVDTDSEGEEDWSIIRGSSAPKDAKKKRIVVGNLVFLSARPHVYKDMAEKRVYSKFERMIRAKNLHAMPTLLPGDLESGQAYMLRGDFEPMARKKLRNMVEYHSIYPEFSHVFVCDNGQADVRAAELMKERLGASLEAVYVHQVQPIDKTFGFNETCMSKWAKMNIVFYKTFIGAATDACRRQLIEADALRQVCLSAVKEFVEMSSVYGSAKFPGGLVGLEERRLELTMDLVKANELLEQRGFQSVSPPRALCMFPVGSTVHTRHFGEGFVRAFRPVDGIYEVAILTGTLIGYFTALDLKSTSWGRSASGLFVGHVAHAHASIQVGCRVSTPYGEGVVRRYRPSDEIFEVILTKWPALAFLREESLVVGQQTSTRTRIWGYGQALIRRTFSSSRPSSPTQRPASSPPIQSQSPPLPTVKVEIGDVVTVSPFGQATVLAPAREDDQIVHVKFDSMVGYVHLSALTLIKRPSKAMTFKLPPVNVAARAMTAMFFGSGESFKVGAPVETPYGRGNVVEKERASDGMVKVRLEWGADAFLSTHVVKKIEATRMTTRILSLLSRHDSGSLLSSPPANPSPSPGPRSSPTSMNSIVPRPPSPYRLDG